MSSLPSSLLQSRLQNQSDNGTTSSKRQKIQKSNENIKGISDGNFNQNQDNNDDQIIDDNNHNNKQKIIQVSQYIYYFLTFNLLYTLL